MNRSTPWIETNLAPPDESPEDWIVQTHCFGGRQLQLARPRDPDRLLDDPSVQQASRSTDYMPYWAYLWPGALLLAEHVLARPRQSELRAIEIGCGLGLAGLAALASGMHVTFSDHSPAALSLAAYNARLNSFDQFTTRQIDWQDPPHDRFDLILGADVLYEARCLPDVLRVLQAMLSDRGEAWLADPDRSVADDFPARASEQSFAVQVSPATTRLGTGRMVAGRMFQVNRVS